MLHANTHFCPLPQNTYAEADTHIGTLHHGDGCKHFIADQTCYYFLNVPKSTVKSQQQDIHNKREPRMGSHLSTTNFDLAGVHVCRQLNMLD